MESDFDCAVLKGEYSYDYTAKYASSSMFMSSIPKRYERDDLESLIYTIWYLVGCDSLGYDGNELLQSKQKGEAKAKMVVSGEMLFFLLKARISFYVWIFQEKCEYFKNDDVRTAFDVVSDEMISEKEVPNFKRMVDVLAEAIEKVNEGPNPPQFEWLQQNTSSYSNELKNRS